MKESLFHAELAQAIRAVGAWAAKWPDQAVSRMQAASDGKLRFSVPKPCDLVGCLAGRFLAIECKLYRQRSFRVDDHIAHQIEVLDGIRAAGGLTALALNFRFESRRPPERVNRAFMVWDPKPAWFIPGMAWTLELVAAVAVELPRRTGGWAVTATMLPSPRSAGPDGT